MQLAHEGAHADPDYLHRCLLLFRAGHAESAWLDTGHQPARTCSSRTTAPSRWLMYCCMDGLSRRQSPASVSASARPRCRGAARARTSACCSANAPGKVLIEIKVSLAEQHQETRQQSRKLDESQVRRSLCSAGRNTAVTDSEIRACGLPIASRLGLAIVVQSHCIPFPQATCPECNAGAHSA